MNVKIFLVLECKEKESSKKIELPCECKDCLEWRMTSRIPPKRNEPRKKKDAKSSPRKARRREKKRPQKSRRKPRPGVIVKIKEEVVQKFLCPKCSDSFATKWVLLNHMSVIHKRVSYMRDLKALPMIKTETSWNVLILFVLYEISISLFKFYFFKIYHTASTFLLFIFKLLSSLRYIYTNKRKNFALFILHKYFFEDIVQRKITGKLVRSVETCHAKFFVMRIPYSCFFLFFSRLQRSRILQAFGATLLLCMRQGV